MDLLGLLLTVDRHPLWPSAVCDIERWLHALTEPGVAAAEQHTKATTTA